MQDSEAVVARLQLLHDRGIRFAVDDFGLGYSSLRYLLRFPIDMIKIPKPFIDRVEAGGSEAMIARAIVAFAQSLGLPTVAEGVEHKAELDVLRDLGCCGFQGYFFAKPMNATAVIGLLAGARASSKVFVAAPGGSAVAVLTARADLSVADGSAANLSA